MMGIKKKISKLIGKWRFLSFAYAVYLFIFSPSKVTYVKHPAFEGWGMTTTTRTPWENNGAHALTKSFSECDNRLKTHVINEEFVLSQFPQMFPEKDQIKFLNELNWRHYIVFWSSIYAIKNTLTEQKNLVECGVCDGLTIFYAMSAAKSINKPCSAYLYDAWDAMKEDFLLESEKDLVGQYSYLDVNATKKNLSMFDSDKLIFNKGYFKESKLLNINFYSTIKTRICKIYL